MTWMEELQAKYSASIASIFIIHGNTNDYACNSDVYHKDPAHLLKLFLGDRDLLIYYDRVLGWQFPVGEEHEKKARSVLEARPSAQQQGGRRGGADPYATAMQQAGIKEPLPKLPVAAFAEFGRILRHRPEGEEQPWDVGLIIDYAESLVTSTNWTNSDTDGLVVSLLQWAVDTGVRSCNTMIVLVCRDAIEGLHPALQNPEAKIESVFVPYPNHDERVHFLNRCLTDYPEIAELKPDIPALAVATAGLSAKLIEDCLLKSSQMKNMDPAIVKERKDSVIKQRYGSVLELAEPTFGFEAIGGLQEMKDFFNRDVITPMKEGNLQRVPMGVLLMGPPGTGKSALAEALAYICKVLFVQLRFSKIFSKWIGDSERNLDRILNAVKQLAPAIVFIDELDSTGHRRDNAFQGDSGIGARVFQRLLEFMGDTSHRGKIVFLAATNRPDLIDPAMKRAGRFDIKVPFFPPDRTERAQIISAICFKNGIKLKGEVSDGFLDATEAYVGADLEIMVTKARNLVEDRTNKRNIVTSETLDEIVQVIRPSVPTEVIAAMTDIAKMECNDLRLLPKRMRSGFRIVDGGKTVAKIPPTAG